ncbi:hypothetical protein [Vibrio sp. SCSIO 43137]|uniref:hypothetical protein n=1 Tax=Vibrio sp. SCSIO 43137 TaxID=3021011 RepID=UPI002307323C|nr:hypothetical protein [Vibrio sp. SCSIO 43137]WCE31801.1 hypothetical protein PK654_22000 [Vibrio sp. SCSIO 43137]
MDLKEIKQGLSTEKLETYRQALSCKSDAELIAVYMAMQSIQSHFFVVVQLLEVTLRNSIHQSATECFGDDEWYKRIPISAKSKKQVDFAELQCLEDVGYKYTSNDLVSRLPFRFWVHMLHKSYNNPRDKERNLWQTQLDKCFPNAREQKVKLNALFQKIGSLNKFRNRLFHHEPAWKGRCTKDRESAIRYLLKMYKEHLAAIYLLSASKREMIAVLRFEAKFSEECDTKSLQKFELILATRDNEKEKHR